MAARVHALPSHHVGPSQRSTRGNRCRLNGFLRCAIGTSIIMNTPNLRRQVS